MMLRRIAKKAPRITPGANCVYSMYAKYKLLWFSMFVVPFLPWYFVLVLSCVGDGRIGGGGNAHRSDNPVISQHGRLERRGRLAV